MDMYERNRLLEQFNDKVVALRQKLDSDRLGQERIPYEQQGPHGKFYLNMLSIKNRSKYFWKSEIQRSGAEDLWKKMIEQLISVMEKITKDQDIRAEDIQVFLETNCSPEIIRKINSLEATSRLSLPPSNYDYEGMAKLMTLATILTGGLALIFIIGYEVRHHIKKNRALKEIKKAAEKELKDLQPLLPIKTLKSIFLSKTWEETIPGLAEAQNTATEEEKMDATQKELLTEKRNLCKELACTLHKQKQPLSMGSSLMNQCIPGDIRRLGNREEIKKCIDTLPEWDIDHILKNMARISEAQVAQPKTGFFSSINRSNETQQFYETCKEISAKLNSAKDIKAITQKLREPTPKNNPESKDQGVKRKR